jgi:hypothetical protein
LHYASENSFAEIITFLVQNGADENIKNSVSLFLLQKNIYVIILYLFKYRKEKRRLIWRNLKKLSSCSKLLQVQRHRTIRQLWSTPLVVFLLRQSNNPKIK